VSRMSSAVPSRCDLARSAASSRTTAGCGGLTSHDGRGHYGARDTSNTDDQRDRKMIWIELFVCMAVVAGLVLWLDRKIGL
jgi:hypothetical protein